MINPDLQLIKPPSPPQIHPWFINRGWWLYMGNEVIRVKEGLKFINGGARAPIYPEI